MDIINEKIWNTIQKYIDEDIENIQNVNELENTLKKLKKDYPEYYNEIKTLLEQRITATNFFAQLGTDIQSSIEEKHFHPGYQIGVYQIDKLISSGGMSNVYLANRGDGQFEQQVAIKVLKESIANKTLQEQFQHEMQILASLNHPNIATIYDGGLTKEGRPYFIMEYIDGESITDYCDHHRLTIEERLRLFIEVTKAVNYAHQNLIIHKDLKPGNILVDKNGYLKLMDFGVAQIIQEKTTETTGFRAFTPKYASPEQKTGNKVTTLSDVYQLGLLLTKLLTGVHLNDIGPSFIKKGFHADYLQISNNERKLILKKRNLQTEKQLKSFLIGDLHSILVTSLKSDPEERYRTVQEIQNDIQNYFEKQPLKARRQNFNYLFSKFIKRNRTKINIALFFILVTTGITANYTIQLSNQKDEANQNAAFAQKEAKRAQSVTNYLISLFSLGDPYINSVKNISVDQLLEKGYNRLNKATTLDPDSKADILITMSNVFMENAKFDKSLDALQRAHFIKDSLKPNNHPDLSDVYSQYASFYKTQRQIDTAFQFIHKALIIDSLHMEEHPINYTYNLEKLGKLHAFKENYDTAVPIYRKVLRRMRQENDMNKKIKIASVESTLGEIFFKLGQFDSSRKYLTRSYKVHAAMEDTTNAYLLHDLFKMGQLYLKLEQLDSAEMFINQSIKKIKQVFGENYIQLASNYSIAASIAQQRYEFQKSLSYAENAYKIIVQHHGKNHIRTAGRLNTIGVTYIHFGMPGKAEEIYRKSLAIKEKYYPEYKRSISVSKYNLAATLMKQGKTEQAISRFKEVYESEKEIYPDNHPNFAYTMTILGRTLIDANKPDQAYPLLKDAYAIIKEKFDSIHSRRASCATAFAEYYLEKQKWKQAGDFAKEGMIIYEQINGKDHWSYEYTSALNILSKWAENNNIQYSGQIEEIIHSMRKQPFVEEYYMNKLIQYARELKINLPKTSPA